MVETRIKPYDQQVAEREAREQQTRAFRRNQVYWVGDSRRRRSVCGGCCTPIRSGFFRRGGGGGRVLRGRRIALDESRLTRLVVILLGPTGSGKTALSLALAERFGGEIVSCDSVAVYRGMELGTAKPTREERARVPHHLIDVADAGRAVHRG